MTALNPVEYDRRLFRLHQRGLSLRLCGELAIGRDDAVLAQVEALTGPELSNLNRIDDPRSDQ